jgi:hypothetical protein
MICDILSRGFFIPVTFEAAEKVQIISLFLFFSTISSNVIKSIIHPLFNGQKTVSHNASLKLISFE